ncbi:hypothetical protein ACFCVO_11510 [Agromyces sp. NPDC056379]|uniref:hypothetical protein n=1 Tax=unclassified Agromyces TaxID=2639701 RepID=UPI0035DD2977
MLISEIAFPHLVAANDERIAVDLERRRVALERRAEAVATTGAAPAAPAAATERSPRHGASRRHPANRMPRPAA